MDEVTYLVTLLDEYWNTAVAALGSAIPIRGEVVIE